MKIHRAYISLMIVNVIFARLYSPEETKFTTDIKEYLTNAKLNLPSIYETVAFTGTTDSNTGPIVDWFINSIVNLPVRIRNNGFILNTSVFLPKIKMAFSFINSVQDFPMIFQQAQLYAFWEPKGYFQFIICEPVQNLNWLHDTLKLIWKNNLVNFVVVFSHQRLEVISYNPFFDQILNYTFKPGNFNVFPNKLLDMNGYALKVAMFDDPPRNVLRKGKFQGPDIILLQSFAKKINASIQYVITGKSYLGIFNFLLLGQADFSFTKSFVSTNCNGIHFSYPQSIDYIVVVVPKADREPHYENLFLTYQEQAWSAIGVLTVSMILLYFLFSFSLLKRAFKISYVRSLFDVIQILFSVPLTRLNSRLWRVKILTLMWIISSMLLHTGFRSSLISVMIKPKYDGDIKTLDQLQTSNLKLAMPAIFAKIVSREKNLHKHVVVLSREIILKKVLRRDTDYAFAMPLIYALYPVRKYSLNGGPLYHIVEEYLIPGFFAYPFPSQSPYEKLINNYVTKAMQYGLSVPLSAENLPLLKTYGASDKTVLTLVHLKAAFYLLMFGHVLSLVAFILEMVYSKLQNRRKK